MFVPWSSKWGLVSLDLQYDKTDLSVAGTVCEKFRYTTVT